MQALSIPTTRSLSLISLPSLPVARERLEYGCILTRVAPSFLRIGSFEALNGPPSKWFFGGGGQEAHWDALRVLGEWVVKRVLRLDIGDRKAWGRELVLEVARRNARMVAAWQAYGFVPPLSIYWAWRGFLTFPSNLFQIHAWCHQHRQVSLGAFLKCGWLTGEFSVSILGLTIDYGWYLSPFAWCDRLILFILQGHMLSWTSSTPTTSATTRTRKGGMPIWQVFLMDTFYRS
jgi:hypothetical protein